jgi:hypothetical protein
MVRDSEYAEKLRQATALNILKRRELRQKLDMPPRTFPSVESLPERIGYTVRDVLKRANNPQAKGLLRKLKGSSVLDKVFYLRRGKLTQKKAREILDNRKDFRGDLRLEKHPHAEDKTKSVGLTDLLVTAEASHAADQIYTSSGHTEGQQWVLEVTKFAREDAEAALAIMKEEAKKR